MTAVAWIALALVLVSLIGGIALPFALTQPQPKHRASRRRPSGDRLTDYSYDDDGDWPKPLMLGRGDTLCEAPEGGYISSDECIVCAGEVDDIDDLPPDLAAEALQAMRDCETEATVRLKRSLEQADAADALAVIRAMDDGEVRDE